MRLVKGFKLHRLEIPGRVSHRRFTLSYDLKLRDSDRGKANPLQPTLPGYSFYESMKSEGGQ